MQYAPGVGGLPTKGVCCLGFRYIKGEGFYKLSYAKGNGSVISYFKVNHLIYEALHDKKISFLSGLFMIWAGYESI